jgi:glycosyltransferase involved in cell wall biosynthesis
MMKIMTAMYTMKRGGSYDRFIMMLEAFLQRGCAVHCLSLTPIQVKNRYFYNHILFYPFRNKESSMAKSTVLFFFPIWSLWIGWRNRIDLVVAFGSLYAFLQGFSKWILKRPMVTFIRGSSYFGMAVQNSPRYLLHLNKIVEHLGLLFSDRLVTNNTAVRDELLRSLGRRKKIDVQVLYNNIPPMNIREPEDISKTRDKHGLPRDGKILVTAGILNRGKNIETLIKSLSKIEMGSLYALIVGDGSREADFRDRDFLQGLAKKLGVDRQVIFTGWFEKEEVWKIYLASDLFVLPSLSEGMPNAMLEALGLGLPCIGSDVPGIKDLLQYDDLLFHPLDEKALALKIRQALLDSQFFGRIKTLCEERKKVFEFDWSERMFQMVTMGFNRACQET